MRKYFHAGGMISVKQLSAVKQKSPPEGGLSCPGLKSASSPLSGIYVAMSAYLTSIKLTLFGSTTIESKQFRFAIDRGC
jgi:hypothetical protein